MGRLKHLVQTDVKGALKTSAAIRGISNNCRRKGGTSVWSELEQVMGQPTGALQKRVWVLQSSQADCKPAVFSCCCEQHMLSWNRKTEVYPAGLLRKPVSHSTGRISEPWRRALRGSSIQGRAGDGSGAEGTAHAVTQQSTREYVVKTEWGRRGMEYRGTS